MNLLTFSFVMIFATVAIAAGDAKQKVIPQETCQAAVSILANADAMCILQPNDLPIAGRDWKHYDCIDKEGKWFLVTRTPRDKT